MERVWKNLLATLTKELGTEVARTFVKSLYEKADGSINQASIFFYELGKVWAPLMHMWAKWIEEKAESKSIALILRDAKPLEHIERTKSWKRLYLNRRICGIPDEIYGDKNPEIDPLLISYLYQNECHEYFTFVDSGCYGSIVRELHIKLKMNFQPLFFFSKNPHIPGFLNDIGVNEIEGTILNDSLECAFPNLFRRPEEIVNTRKDGVQPFLMPSDELSLIFGEAVLRGVRDFQFKNHTTPQSAMKNILELSEKAQDGIFTGVLAESSPEWTGKKAFLESWPSELKWK